MLFPHSLGAISHGSDCVRGLGTRIRRLEARIAAYQHADAQTEDSRANDRHHDRCGTIEEEEADEGSDYGTNDRACESSNDQPAAKPPTHPGVGRGFHLHSALALSVGRLFLHRGVIPAGLDSNLAPDVLCTTAASVLWHVGVRKRPTLSGLGAQRCPYFRFISASSPTTTARAGPTQSVTGSRRTTAKPVCGPRTASCVAVTDGAPAFNVEREALMVRRSHYGLLMVDQFADR
jgi:hypothetical protein